MAQKRSHRAPRMRASTRIFIERLSALQPEAALSPVADLYVAVSVLEPGPLEPEAIAAVFRFFEEHPEADHGAPGPLVSLLEKQRGRYHSELKDSVARAPVPTTLWMVNRILNAEVDVHVGAEWKSLLNDVARGSRNPSLRELAREYLDFQESRDGPD